MAADGAKNNTSAATSRDPNAPGTRHPFLKSLHQLLLRQAGVDTKRLFAEALVTNSRRLLARRLEHSPHRSLLEAEDLRDHYADIEVTDAGLRNVLLSFIVARLTFIETLLGPEEIAQSTFLDVGDSDGIFVRALKKRGVSVNTSECGVKSIAAKGVHAVRGDATHLPLRDNACDYVLCFETLEHLPNPLGGLWELFRVCRKGAFISVPHVSQTTVYPLKFRDIPQDLLHIFELSPSHWTALLSHTPFKVEKAEVLPVVEWPRGFREMLAFGVWRTLFGTDLFYGTFRGFLTFYLMKS